MLVLSRKKNESIVINNDVVITVVEIRGDKVRLGIVAPKDVPVHREEVYQAIHGTTPKVEPNNVDACGRAALSRFSEPEVTAVSSAIRVCGPTLPRDGPFTPSTR